MDENKKEMDGMPVEEMTEMVERCTLTDDEGNEFEFDIIDSAELGGVKYYAMIPTDAEPTDDGIFEYVIVKEEVGEDGEIFIVSVDDDEECDRVADYFEDKLVGEIDYDVED